MSTKSLAQLIEIAVRENLTFSSPNGELLPQDLFKLPLTSTRANAATLDGLALALNAQIEAKEGKVLSFVKPAPTGKVNFTTVKFDIVKAILDEKLAERDAAAVASVKAEKRQKIMALLERKDEEALGSMSRDELLKLLED
jgi:hypothetical protein